MPASISRNAITTRRSRPIIPASAPSRTRSAPRSSMVRSRWRPSTPRRARRQIRPSISATAIEARTLIIRLMTMIRLCAILIGAMLLGAPAVAQSFPKFTGLVVDAAEVLPPQTEADLTAKLQALQKDTHRQLVVVTVPDLQGYPIDDYGYKLGREWGVGLRDVNNGVI